MGDYFVHVNAKMFALLLSKVVCKELEVDIRI